ncbi:MAG: hypothetical protein NTY30_02910 [Candidatus Berkelbacteria bacterium]|nr:hypothetical protein [Candidatus Berkelbacteria bacterium]
MIKIDLEKIKNTTITILQTISDILEEGHELFSYEAYKRSVYYQQGDPRRHTKWYYNNLKSIEHRGYIKIDRNYGSVELTRKGRIKLIENSSEKMVDGKWRMVSWDIPESLKTKRRHLSRSIRRIGYKQVQKSLWACPFVKADEVDLIIEELALRKYVACLRVDKTDIDDHLVQLFKADLKK